MIARGRGGKVVNIGSVTSLFSLPYTSVYTMTKSALAGVDADVGGRMGQVRHSGQLYCSWVHSHPAEPEDVGTLRNARVASTLPGQPSIGNTQGHRRLGGVFVRSEHRLRDRAVDRLRWRLHERLELASGGLTRGGGRHGPLISAAREEISRKLRERAVPVRARARGLRPAALSSSAQGFLDRGELWPTAPSKPRLTERRPLDPPTQT